MTPLRTKLNRPRLRQVHTPRPALVARLNSGLDGDITLVTAPAGHGKTSLAVEWAAQSPLPVAWLALDPSDDDVNVFLSYLVAAIRTLFPDACPTTLALIQDEHSAQSDLLPTIFVNEIDDLPQRFVVVIDDYHEITQPPVHQLLDRVLRRPPAQMHLMLLGRADPPLSLGRLRAMGLLNELGVKDLRFNPSEAEALMQQLTGPLDDRAAALLLQRTEGWVAGLQLASLSLRSAADTTAMLDILKAENNSYVFDYLFEQVLSQQPPSVREYLVKTSILDRISPSLARAVVGPGAAMPTTLVEVERAGLFLNALDNSGEWFTYHTLFRDALRKLLADTYTPAEIAVLHLRASEWFEQHGLIEDAVTHALAGGDPSLAARILAARIADHLSPEGWRTIDHWLGYLEPPTLALNPLLLVAKAYVLMYQFKWDAMLPFISQAEAQLADPDAALDPEHKAMARAFLHWIWAYRWITTLQAQPAYDAARRALALMPAQYGAASGMILHALAIAMQWLGKAEDAERLLNEALIAVPAQSTDPQAIFGPLQSLVTLLLAEGYLARGSQVAEILLQKADELGAPNMKAWAYLSLGAAAYYGDEALRAIDYFAAAVQLRYSSNPVASEQCFIGLALSYQVLGRDDEVRGVLATMLDYHRELALPVLNDDYRALQARVAILRGDVDTARQWSGHKVSDAGLAIGWLVVPVVANVRVRLVDNPSPADLDEMLAELDRLLGLLVNLRQPTRQTELLSLKAAALHKRGRRPEAHQALDEALALAEPRGLIRPIADIGLALEPLLQEKVRAHSSAYLVRLLNALRPAATAPQIALPEKPRLTTREREVLALLAQYQTDRVIAATLVISPVTVRTHIENLAGKLGVRGRRAIVNRARELALLPGAG